jgi:hypothetical protein
MSSEQSYFVLHSSNPNIKLGDGLGLENGLPGEFAHMNDGEAITIQTRDGEVVSMVVWKHGSLDAWNEERNNGRFADNPEDLSAGRE